MFQKRTQQTRLQTALAMAGLVFHSAAHSVRANHRLAIMSIIANIFRIVVIMGIFLMMYQILGMRRSAVRGDFVLFLLTGVFLYVTHVRTVGAVAGAAGPTAPMMQHAPMNPFIEIASTALASFYTQFLSLLVILFFYYVAVNHFVIDQPVGAFFCFLATWFTGVAVGLVFMAMKPWSPGVTDICLTLYRRINMIASGKLFLANNLQPSMRNLFDWNPLFHAIDQARGFTFINYYPHFTSLAYAWYVGLAIFCIGLIAEYYTTRKASLSWDARR
ncbi:ABC transporter permease [Pseudooceanicola algae]|uniref:ABC-2 type transporter n=1 Tax=Pseudooceanicola algae TaxID=1537215 RepID=A0A418SBB3_9RHOB|nr:ABC transporter permease [Pseudooceanicola algae]QPM91408.1 hypothetical protein PSAL_026610 [Pseudooceanicola algae]